MKRDPALVSLSHDHHQALFAAQKLVRAQEDTAADALASLTAYWSCHGQAHFRAEEEILFPAYARHGDPYDPLLARALCDHAAIRAHIQSVDAAASTDLSKLHELGRLIQEHVRLEERRLFPAIEGALPAEDLAAIAEALAAAEA